MDFSFLQPNARRFLLRDVTALKARWPYYSIMVIDPILRFSWIFYAIFTHDTQHSTIMSFLVAFAEVTRRGMWAFFRVENEHCANVSQYKASRDVPLPYRIEPLVARDSAELSPEVVPIPAVSPSVGTARTTGARVSAEGDDGIEATLRRRAGTMGGAIRMRLAEAHKQDFVKKKRPEGETQAEAEEAEALQSDDDEGDEDSGSEGEVAQLSAEEEDRAIGKSSRSPER